MFVAGVKCEWYLERRPLEHRRPPQRGSLEGSACEPEETQRLQGGRSLASVERARREKSRLLVPTRSTYDECYRVEGQKETECCCFCCQQLKRKCSLFTKIADLLGVV